MLGKHNKSKIIQKDGVVYYAHREDLGIPLSKLALECGYRIDKLCAVLDISPRHFRRQFDKCFGICPKQWLKSERMVFARNLLRGGLTIKEASDKLGFAAQKEFHREFKEYYSVAPTDYRAQNTKRVMECLGLDG
jgi:AraC-like DNA-binding protein